MRTVLFSLLLLAGCGEFVDFTPPPMQGRSCSADSDCVPNGCCGEATTAIHSLDAPQCSGVSCTGQCPAMQLRCGCGVPICRDARCSVAVASGPGC